MMRHRPVVLKRRQKNYVHTTQTKDLLVCKNYTSPYGVLGQQKVNSG